MIFTRRVDLIFSVFFMLLSNYGFAGEAPSLEAALASEHRTPAYVLRDKYRHPAETLTFFGLRPNMTVIEISPGGGWYTEILAPYLREEGIYYAAHFPAGSDIKYFQRGLKNFKAKLKARPELYDKIKLTEFDPKAGKKIAPDGSADMVLTFRNVHNWIKGNYGKEAFRDFYKALKPGGILGLVEHRAEAGTARDNKGKSGYVSEDTVIKLAEKAGFKLVEKSEINANPKDKANHPKGVWTLPPALRLGEEKRDHYLSIGESDRMTIKFQKPSK